MSNMRQTFFYVASYTDLCILRGMAKRTTPKSVADLITEAIGIAGSQAKLGKAAGGFSQNAIWHAKRTGSVSARLAVGIERATNGAVSKHALCPDVFGDAGGTAS
jgi:hypothetical protein